MPDYTGQAEDAPIVDVNAPVYGDTPDPAIAQQRQTDYMNQRRAAEAAALARQQAADAAERARYSANPVDLSGAPAWWNIGGGGSAPPPQPTTPQPPVAKPVAPSMPVQRPQQPPPQFADVSKPRPALGIPNWRNYSSALRG